LVTLIVTSCRYSTHQTNNLAVFSKVTILHYERGEGNTDS